MHGTSDRRARRGLGTKRLWPSNHDYLEKALADVPDEDAVKIAETNLRKLLNV
jgi:hypothetical protein